MSWKEREVIAKSSDTETVVFLKKAYPRGETKYLKVCDVVGVECFSDFASVPADLNLAVSAEILAFNDDGLPTQITIERLKPTIKNAANLEGFTPETRNIVITWDGGNRIVEVNEYVPTKLSSGLVVAVPETSRKLTYDRYGRLSAIMSFLHGHDTQPLSLEGNLHSKTFGHNTVTTGYYQVDAARDYFVLWMARVRQYDPITHQCVSAADYANTRITSKNSDVGQRILPENGDYLFMVNDGMYKTIPSIMPAQINLPIRTKNTYPKVNA